MTTLSPAELEARLRLHSLPGLGPRRWQRLWSAFGNACAALSAPSSAWRTLGIPADCVAQRRSTDIRQRVDATLAWLEQPQHHAIFSDQPEYPALLLEIPDPPPVLFARGNISRLEQPQIAIIGSRNASVHGTDNAQRFARCLAGGGFGITSGLALGIDTAAHQGALEAAGYTVAVMGTGMQRIYPARNQALAERIVHADGVLLSELPLDAPPHASHFPRRNRIISGLSLGVLVVEAGVASGSLITARLALEQNREVFAIPGSIHHPGARGCHQLIRQGAQLVESADDILQTLHGWQQIHLPVESPNVHTTNPEPTSPLLHTIRSGPLSAEQLAAHLQSPLPEVLAQLTEYEIMGQVVCENGYWRVRQA